MYQQTVLVKHARQSGDAYKIDEKERKDGCASHLQTMDEAVRESSQVCLERYLVLPAFGGVEPLTGSSNKTARLRALLVGPLMSCQRS